MTPTNIALHQKSRLLELIWPDGVVHSLPCEYLRVYSPSAEVRGHGRGQETLQLGKENVNIIALQPVGHYALKIVFDDKHDSGLYDWNLLRDLGDKYEAYWADYLQRCKDANYVRKESNLNDDE
ncbi:MAG: 1-(5-phosphoribosyl)-5-((5-phosphoribosylamino)methylideneamino)imidazole-4-carboxamide isomerase [Proteobacteria bacterium]|nr:MAG: 1-(5-phosphoribosyl)-5-((5-phosphoribosylamino)methylideneamino)imidazole-4-carboxamide isomerase [Pseudomonadota bacterium]